MENIIVELSKYLIIILMTMYTIHGFFVFPVKKEQKKQEMLRKQRMILFTMQFAANLVLYLTMKDIQILLFYLCQLVLIIGVMALYPFVYHNLSKSILNNMMLFLTISFLMLARLSLKTAYRQFVIAAAALIFGLFIPIIIEKWKGLQKLGWLYAAVGIALLLFVLICGRVQYGAKNWVSVGGVMLQPSEFVKILFVFFVASCLSKEPSFKKTVIVTAVAAAHVMILVLETDLGGALILFVTYVCMLYVATQKSLYLFAGFGSGAVASVIAYFLFGHVRTRVSSWSNPWADITGGGYQITQSLFAIGTGGWFGFGLGKGLPTSIPVAVSDFIFSAISEELGGIFAVCLIMLYLSCFILFVHASMKIRNGFYKLTAMGLSVIFIFQVFLCVGGVTKFIPSTGVTLPLISYGGSSVLSTVILFSIIQGLYVINQNEDEKVEKEKRKEKRKNKREAKESFR